MYSFSGSAQWFVGRIRGAIHLHSNISTLDAVAEAWGSICSKGVYQHSLQYMVLLVCFVIRNLISSLLSHETL